MAAHNRALGSRESDTRRMTAIIMTNRVGGDGRACVRRRWRRRREQWSSRGDHRVSACDATTQQMVGFTKPSRGSDPCWRPRSQPTILGPRIIFHNLFPTKPPSYFPLDNISGLYFSVQALPLFWYTVKITKITLNSGDRPRVGLSLRGGQASPNPPYPCEGTIDERSSLAQRQAGRWYAVTGRRYWARGAIFAGDPRSLRSVVSNASGKSFFFFDFPFFRISMRPSDLRSVFSGPFTSGFYAADALERFLRLDGDRNSTFLYLFNTIFNSPIIVFFSFFS